MDTVTIPQQEYNELKNLAKKVKMIDKMIHDDLSTEEIMKLQEKQKTLMFLKEEEEIYSEADISE
jgi:hypothetical protein